MTAAARDTIDNIETEAGAGTLWTFCTYSLRGESRVARLDWTAEDLAVMQSQGRKRPLKAWVWKEAPDDMDRPLNSDDGAGARGCLGTIPVESYRLVDRTPEYTMESALLRSIARMLNPCPKAREAIDWLQEIEWIERNPKILVPQSSRVKRTPKMPKQCEAQRERKHLLLRQLMAYLEAVGCKSGTSSDLALLGSHRHTRVNAGFRKHRKITGRSFGCQVRARD